jgi:hypothetical protein
MIQVKLQSLAIKKGQRSLSITAGAGYCEYLGMLRTSKTKKWLIMITAWIVFALSLILLLKTCGAEACLEPTTCDRITDSSNAALLIFPDSGFDQELPI